MQPNSFAYPIIPTQTTDEAGGQFDCRPFNSLTVWMIGTGTITSGVVTIEEAHDPTYTGTWSTIATLDADDVTGGAAQAYHVGGPGGIFNYAWIRVRISTVIGGGGTVALVLTGN